MKRRSIAMMIAALCSIACVTAQEFAGLVRDDMALGLTPTVSSWGMGGAYVGVPGVDSMNPAALAFAKAGQLELGGGYWSMTHGPDVYSGRTDVVFPFVLDSHARLMGYYYASDGYERTDLGLEAQLESQTLGLQLGLPITEDLAIGVGAYPHEKGRVDLRVPNGPDFVEAEANSQVGSIQAGAQWRATDELTIGIEAIYIIDELQAEDGVTEYASDYRIHYEAIGASYRIAEKTLVAVDFRTGEIEGEAYPSGSFDQDIHRWHYGVAHQLTDTLTVRAGSTNDGLTLGASIQLTEHLGLNYVFNDAAFRDKESALGEIDVHALSLTYTF